ncbi:MULTISPECIES: hypothetical protein [Nocardia]|uniref:hypothetical protein n=1 Tax=Nocardia TaxID=1817 RepID=UPI0018950584|nr:MULTISPECIES: hypothetical protein [Nocardia]MBF6352561.1 hypothetical protein [Nocardia flavorosea]
MTDKLGRGDEVRRPTGWVVRVVDRQAAIGWAALRSQVPGNLDRAWFALTADPRCRDEPARQHPLKYDLARVKIDAIELEQWQYEVTGGGRVWYAIDDESRTVWITQAGAGHPKQTDRRRR